MAAETLLEKEWVIDGVSRQALLSLPQIPTDKSTPIIFVFHGHGGTMHSSVQRYNFHVQWPDAAVIYMQGLPTPGKYDPEGLKTGWQQRKGDHKDRDLLFFDTALASLRNDYKITNSKVFIMGHSNGGRFTYLLWSERCATLNAVAVSNGGVSRSNKRKPLPAMHIAGKFDKTVPFKNQERTMHGIVKLNLCNENGQILHQDDDYIMTTYDSEDGAPFTAVIYNGGHKLFRKAPNLIIDFFKKQHSN